MLTLGTIGKSKLMLAMTAFSAVFVAAPSMLASPISSSRAHYSTSNLTLDIRIGATDDPAVYHVAPWGDDEHAGSSTEPFATIQHASDIVKPGDTVIVRDGIYTDTNGDGFGVFLDRGGTSSQWVTFRSENARGAVLSGQNNTTDYGWGFGSNADHVVVEGFELTQFAHGGVWANSTSNNVVIRGNEIHDMGRRCTETSLGTGLGFYLNGISDWVIEQNVVHTNGRLHNNERCSYPRGFFYDTNHDHGIYADDLSGLTIRNNVFYDHDSGWAIQVTPSSAAEGLWIVNNTFADSNPAREGHILFVGRITGLVANNLFYHPNDAILYPYDLTGGGQVTISHNITTVRKIFPDWAHPDNDPPYRRAGYLDDGTNILNADPLLVDPTSDPWSLICRSVCHQEACLWEQPGCAPVLLPQGVPER